MVFLPLTKTDTLIGQKILQNNFAECKKQSSEQSLGAEVIQLLWNSACQIFGIWIRTLFLLIENILSNSS